MNVWDWVYKLTDELEEAGEERVASLFHRIYDYVADQDIPQAEAILPEALAAARAMENPWAEVFFRHWEMRLRLGTKGEGESALPDVVALLDFAHSKECEGCPQSVCTTQDIADCYCNIDGPGWAPERRAVALEALAKITPDWNCHGCLSHEYMEALMDEKRHAEALDFFQSYEAKELEAGKELDANDFTLKAEILLKLGRTEEALAALDKAQEDSDIDDEVRTRMGEKRMRVHVLTALGRHEEAWDILPPWGDIVPGNYDDWLEAAAALAQALPEHNSGWLGSCFQQGLEHFSRVGAHRHVMDIGQKAAQLAMARGAYFTPRRVLRLMRQHLPKLRAPLGADQMLAELEQAVAGLRPPSLPVPAAELLEYFGSLEGRDAEKDMDMLYAAMEERPEDLDILRTACSALSAMHAKDEARDLLREYIRRHPDDCEDAVNLFISYTPSDQGDELAALADHLDETQPYLAHWLRLYKAHDEMNLAAVAEQAGRYLAERPDSIGARMLWAETALTAKEFGEATRLRREITELAAAKDDPNLNDHRWDLLVAAACAGEHRLLRDTCIAMGFDIEPGDTPIDDPGAYVRIRFEEDGRQRTAIARRSGPVTARIVSAFWANQIQRTEDLVVFDPEPLEPFPEDEEERENFLPPYKLVHTLSQGNFKSWLVDGFYPGREEFVRLQENLEKRGFYVDVRCEGDYTVADPAWEGGPEEAEAVDSDEEAPFPPPGRLDGIYFLLAAPAAFSPAELDDILTEETKTWPHPLCWHELAKAAGRSPEKHQAIIERYGL